MSEPLAELAQRLYGAQHAQAYRSSPLRLCGFMHWLSSVCNWPSSCTLPRLQTRTTMSAGIRDALRPAQGCTAL